MSQQLRSHSRLAVSKQDNVAAALQDLNAAVTLCVMSLASSACNLGDRRVPLRGSGAGPASSIVALGATCTAIRGTGRVLSVREAIQDSLPRLNSVALLVRTAVRRRTLAARDSLATSSVILRVFSLHLRHAENWETGAGSDRINVVRVKIYFVIFSVLHDVRKLSQRVAQSSASDALVDKMNVVITKGSSVISSARRRVN